MRFTDYMRGTIFGLVLACLAFAFALQITTDGQHANYVSQQSSGPSGDQRQQPESFWRLWWEWVTHDASGFFTLALCGIGGAQAVLFYWQLGLISDGTSDTKQAAEAAKEQAKLARESLIASQRAWIKADVPIIHVSVHTTGSSMWGWAGIPIENAGNAPALKINPQIWLGGFGPKGSDADGFHARCEAIRRAPPNQLEFFLFPGESVPATSVTGYGHSIFLGGTEFADVVCVTPHGLKHIQPLLMGCVTYVFPTDQARHQTRFVYEVHRSGGRSFALEDAEIMAEEITLKRHDFGSSFYVD